MESIEAVGAAGLSWSWLSWFDVLVRFGRGEAGSEGGLWSDSFVAVAEGSGGGVVFSLVMIVRRIESEEEEKGKEKKSSFF